jgi:serine/threonine protein kinase
MSSFNTLSILGSGRHSTVSLIQHSDFDLPVTLKECRRYDTCQQELRAVALLQGDGVTPDVLCQKENGFLLRYVESVSMLDILDSERPSTTHSLVPTHLQLQGKDNIVSKVLLSLRKSPHAAVNIFRQMACALALTHKRGVRHRDLHLGNWLISPHPRSVFFSASSDSDLTVYMIDFGASWSGFRKDARALDQAAQDDWQVLVEGMHRVVDFGRRLWWTEEQLKHTLHDIETWIDTLPTLDVC